MFIFWKEVATLPPHLRATLQTKTLLGDEIEKPLTPAAVKVLKRLKRTAVTKTRTRSCGARGVRKIIDKWRWSTGLLFPSQRSDAGESRRNKDTVCKVPGKHCVCRGGERRRGGDEPQETNTRVSMVPFCILGHALFGKAIGRLRQTLVLPKTSAANTGRIRSHSGRHRAINDYKTSKVPKAVGKRVANIKDDSTYGKYGRLSDSQVSIAIKKNSRLAKVIARSY